MPTALTTVRLHALPAGLQTASLAFAVALAAAGTTPDWVQLTPRGDVATRDGRTFRFDPEKLVAAFKAGGVNLPIDFEHETEFVEKLGARPARGWIVELQARAEGLFGRVEWLKDALDALAAKQFRYISPTFWADEKTGAARALKAAALVNSPALGMPALASTQPEDVMDKTVLVALGLAETATAADAIVAINNLRTAAPDPNKFVPIEQHQATATALATAQATIKAADDAAQAARCSTLIDDGVKAGKIAPAAKDHYLALANANFDETKKLVDALPALLKPGADGDAARAAALAGEGDGALTEAELQLCNTLGFTAEQFLASKKAQRDAA